jgi:hypothetical protein
MFPNPDHAASGAWTAWGALGCSSKEVTSSVVFFDTVVEDFYSPARIILPELLYGWAWQAGMRQGGHDQAGLVMPG